VTRDEVLGYGSFGTMYRGTFQGSDVAIKEANRGADTAPALRREVVILKKLSYHHVLRAYGACTLDVARTCIVLELATCNLHDRLRDATQPFGPAEAALAALQICLGLTYMHSKHVFHRDLKPHNVLVMADGTCKIGDFGLAVSAGSTAASSLKPTTSEVGTLRWMAPELIVRKGKKLQRMVRCDKCDAYSFGMVLYELLECKQPWEGLRDESVRAMEEDERPKLTAPIAKQLDVVEEVMGKLWKTEPLQRPPIDQNMAQIFRRARPTAAAAEEVPWPALVDSLRVAQARSTAQSAQKTLLQISARTMGKPWEKDLAFSTGVLSVIIQTVKKFPTDADMSEEACRAIMYLAAGDDSRAEWRRQEAADLDVLRTIRRAIREPTAGAGVQYWGCKALLVITRGYSARA
jgi:serine/threonine protein kinase